MIFLGKEEIEALIDVNMMMDQIEETYRIFGKGAYYMPPRPVIEHENKTLIYMPCYTDEIIGTKMLTMFPENAKLGLPSIDGLVILNDAKTGVAVWQVLDGAGGDGLEDRSRRRCCHPSSGGQGRSYSRDHRGRRTGILSGRVCLCGKRYPYRLRVQSQ